MRAWDVDVFDEDVKRAAFCGQVDDFQTGVIRAAWCAEEAQRADTLVCIAVVRDNVHFVGGTSDLTGTCREFDIGIVGDVIEKNIQFIIADTVVVVVAIATLAVPIRGQVDAVECAVRRGVGNFERVAGDFGTRHVECRGAFAVHSCAESFNVQLEACKEQVLSCHANAGVDVHDNRVLAQAANNAVAGVECRFVTQNGVVAVTTVNVVNRFCQHV